MQKEFNYLVFIGRFQPFHIGHKSVIDRALEMSDKVIVFIGSANSPRTERNPFTFMERKNVILNAFPKELASRLLVNPLNDYTYNDEKWTTETRKAVNDLVLKDLNQGSPSVYLHGIADVKIGLVGYAKDHSSYYLKRFPEWGKHVNVSQKAIFNATDIRAEYFKSTPRISTNILPASTVEFLQSFLDRKEFQTICAEQKYYQGYREAWKNAPYPPTFVTVDAIIVQSGHVLLVKRKELPGKGLYALPGGFLNQNEKIEDAMIRELREETKIKVPDPVLRGNIKKVKVFDDPNRSARGRVITHAHLIHLPMMTELPKVKGGSDASKAEWVKISDIKPDNMFEDHYFIVYNMVADL